MKKIEALTRAITSVAGAMMLHRTSDADHNRTVITFAGSCDAVEEAAFLAAEAALRWIDLREHRGAHPRLGALDVLPFVPLGGSRIEDCVELARRVGERIWRELGIPVYFYESAAKRPDRKQLEAVRRGEFESLLQMCETDATKRPDVGGPGLHPTAGAVIVGARKFLIAFNINLRTDDLRVARDIARRIRSSGGGLLCVKALGLPLASRGIVQVSMNLTDYEQTGLDVVFEQVRKLAVEHGVEIEESELIGLAPRAAWETAAARLLKVREFNSERIIENRIERLA